jgi:prepilin-type N-terminal cleavage/methylation domain-containing protein
MRRTKGFTLIEMLAVLVILVTLAAIVIPRFINAGTRSREAALRQTLAEVRNAISIFRNDTGYYPQQLSDLAATTAPSPGLRSLGAAPAYRPEPTTTVPIWTSCPSAPSPSSRCNIIAIPKRVPGMCVARPPHAHWTAHATTLGKWGA